MQKDTPRSSERKARIRDLSDRLAPDRSRWWRRAAFFHEEDIRYLRFLVPEGAKVLELGCATGALLAALRPGIGTGIDFSSRMISEARALYPNLEFSVADIEDPEWLSKVSGTFDYVIIADTVGSLDDCQATFELLHTVCDRHTRLIIAYYSYFWDPLLRLAERLGLKMPTEEQNVLSPDDISGLLTLADFEVVKRDWRQLVPVRLFGIGSLTNRFIATLPVVRRFCLRHYVVARSRRRADDNLRSASVVIPCRNERGNVQAAIQRLPRFCEDIEVIFVEGHSQDGTLEEVYRVRDAFPEWNIKVLQQDGVGKANAVFKAFDLARGDVLMILDADLTVPPEQLDKFWRAMASGKAEYLQGTRLVYPMANKAMRFLNLLANWVFSVLFTWLLNQRLTDTLCGTKVLRRSDYLRLKENRGDFGYFDPFGDFDLIFGATKLNLKIIEIPIRYASRTYGETQISRFRHGWLLLRMVVFAFRKLKAF